jgi:hypothetical protein
MSCCGTGNRAHGQPFDFCNTRFSICDFYTLVWSRFRSRFIIRNCNYLTLSGPSDADRSLTTIKPDSFTPLQPNTCLPGRLDGNRQPNTCLPSRLDGNRQPNTCLPGRLDGNRQPNTCLPGRLDGIRQPNTCLLGRLDGNRQPNTCLPGRLDGIRQPYRCNC